MKQIADVLGHCYNIKASLISQSWSPVKCPNLKCLNSKCPNSKCLNSKCPNSNCPNSKCLNSKCLNSKCTNSKCPNLKCPNSKCPNLKCPNSKCRNVKNSICCNVCLKNDWKYKSFTNYCHPYKSKFNKKNVFLSK
jgi:hypothetical protein